MKMAPLAILLAAAVITAQQVSVLSTPDAIAIDFKQVPCASKERLRAAQALFERMGASTSDITTQKFRGAENLVVKRQASNSETIIIGAHYDFADLGCGAVDNWTGIVAMAHLYKTIRSLEPQKSLLFVAFDNEERGLVGSRAMANAIPREALPQYCSMINLDSFGLAQPFALSNTSSPALVKAATDVASALQVPFYAATINQADADSSSFLTRGIPAVTLSGLSSKWPSILHSEKDQTDMIGAASVYLGYRLALAMWHHIDQSPCDAFRSPTKK